MSSFGFLGRWMRLARFTAAAAAVSDDAPLQTSVLSGAEEEEEETGSKNSNGLQALI